MFSNLTCAEEERQLKNRKRPSRHNTAESIRACLVKDCTFQISSNQNFTDKNKITKGSYLR